MKNKIIKALMLTSVDVSKLTYNIWQRLYYYSIACTNYDAYYLFTYRAASIIWRRRHGGTFKAKDCKRDTGRTRTRDTSLVRWTVLPSCPSTRSRKACHTSARQRQTISTPSSTTSTRTTSRGLTAAWWWRADSGSAASLRVSRPPYGTSMMPRCRVRRGRTMHARRGTTGSNTWSDTATPRCGQ